MTTRIDRFSSPAAVGPGEVNVWIVGDDEEVIVIDPGTDPAGVLDAVGDREVLAVICTHGHADHDRAPRSSWPNGTRHRWPCTRRTGCCGGGPPGEEADIEMEDGGIFEVADVRLEVSTRRATPVARCACTARTSAWCSPGTPWRPAGRSRDDGEFPDFAGQLTAIGEHLLTLPSDTRVLPGHGAETTIAAAEKKFDSWVTAGPVVTSPSSSAD